MKDHVVMDVTDLAVLMWHLFTAAQSNSIGYNDADKSMDELLKSAQRKVFVRKDTLERLLYSPNMLAESGKFWHHKGRSFEDFVKGLGIEYDKEYGWIKDEETKTGVIRYGKGTKKKIGKYKPSYPTKRRSE